MIDAAIFKDYDIRATYPDQLNGEVAKKIAEGIVSVLKPQTVALCRDMRVSGDELKDALASTFVRLGVDVIDAGVTGTEMAYFIAGTTDHDLVIMISASHNPPNYNGLKIVKKGPVAINSDSGLFAIRDAVAAGISLPDAPTPGTSTTIDIYPEWKKKVLSLIDVSAIKPLSVVVDAGNGMAGKLVPYVFEGLPPKVTPMFFELDGTFPNHVPNPLVESNNAALIAKVREVGADVGITFDGDADRLFLVDDTGRFLSGSVITAMLARYYLTMRPKSLILYSAVCGRIVPETIEKAGGTSMRVRVGHSYVKNYMREKDAVFAGEHSGHYYHRDFFYSESGVLTALMVLSLLSQDGRKLSQIVEELEKYPASGEINFAIPDVEKGIEAIRHGFTDAASKDELDGVSVWYPDWWVNVRASHTEPLLRLNIEANSKEILAAKTKELVTMLESLGGKIK